MSGAPGHARRRAGRGGAHRRPRPQDAGPHLADGRRRRRRPALLQGRDVPAGRRLQGARGLLPPDAPVRGRAAPGRRRLLVGKPRAGRGARGAGPRRSGDDRDARRRPGPEARRHARLRRRGRPLRPAARGPRGDRAAARRGDGASILVPPFDDEAVIAGQGTAALELLEEVPGPRRRRDALRRRRPSRGDGRRRDGSRPGIRVFGVEPEAGDDVARSLREGRRVAIPVPETIADSLQTTRVGERNFAILQALVEGVVTVSDLELRRAMAFLFSRMKLVVEPGGSAAAAALLAGRVPACRGAAGRRRPLGRERRPSPLRRARGGAARLSLSGRRSRRE